MSDVPEPDRAFGAPDRDPRARAKVVAKAVAAVRRLLGDAGAGRAVLEPVGRTGVRLVVVAADGRWGDAVLPDEATGREVCAELGIEPGEWDRDLSSALVTTPADRRRMAGSRR
ncbi:hypothetical protein [Nakamurella endophytica]|uniref:Uncharacterized protein n=1 Tax=Nakamurella endophytica TaxID=1748367 RepID=A0A917SSX0_9ACTN|nr:hypothetical protein [Nakamurella endophytica]GGL93980.1 hypothetical protein GCM10011594_12290 [Nakamurella endophytica]